jgi:hypothetical protein
MPPGRGVPVEYRMTEALNKTKWHSFLQLLSQTLQGKRADIQIVSVRLGNQVEVERLPFLGIAYDSKNDLIEITLEGMEHLIHRPERITIKGDGLMVSAIEIVDGEKTQQILRLHDPLMLAAFR